MKILLVGGDGDYAALSFQNHYKGTRVSDIIENLDDYSVENTENADMDEEDWELSVREIPDEISVETLKFFRDMMDYDHTKHETYFHPNEIID